MSRSSDQQDSESSLSIQIDSDSTSQSQDTVQRQIPQKAVSVQQTSTNNSKIVQKKETQRIPQQNANSKNQAPNSLNSSASSTSPLKSTSKSIKAPQKPIAQIKEEESKEESPSIDLGSTSDSAPEIKQPEPKKSTFSSQKNQIEPKRSEKGAQSGINDLEKCKTNFKELILSNKIQETISVVNQMNEIVIKHQKQTNKGKEEEMKKVGEIIQECVENVFQMIQKDVLENKSIQMLMQILMQFDACFGQQSFYKSKHQIVVDDVQGKINKIQEQVNNMQVDQVEAVYKELTSMNQIVLFEPNLAKGFESVLKQFKNQILRVLNAIIAQFNGNPEKIAIYVQNYMHFVNVALIIPITQQEAFTVKQTLIKGCINQLTQFQQKYSQCTSNLNDIRTIIHKTNLILAVLTKEVKEEIKESLQTWSKNEENFVQQLNNNINKNRDLKYLMLIQNLATELSVLDCFSHKNIKYEQIFDTCEEIMKQTINQLTNVIHQQLQQQQFEQIQQNIYLLNKDDYFINQVSNWIRPQLENLFNNLISPLAQDMNQINVHQMKFTYQILLKVNQAYNISNIQNCNKYFIIDQQSCFKFLQQCLDQILNKLEIENIKQSIMQFISQHKFEQAEQLIFQLTSIRGELKINELFNNLFTQLEQAVDQAILLINQEIQIQQQLISQYTFQSSTSSPTAFLNALKDASKLNNKYNEHIVVIQNEIIKTLNSEIQSFESKNSIKIEEYLNLVETRKNLFPVEVIDGINDLLDNLNNIYRNKQDEVEEVVQLGTAATDLHEIIDRYVSCARNPEYGQLKKYQEIIQNENKKSYEKYIDYIKNNSLDLLFNKLPQEWDDWTYYQIELKKLETACQDKKYANLYKDATIKAYCSKILTELNKAISLSLSQITQLTNVDDLKNVEPMSKNFDKLRLFLEIACNDSTLGKDMLAADKNLLTQVQNILPKMLSIFNSNTEKFKKSLVDVAELKTVLAFAEKASETHKNLLEFSQSEIGSKFKDFQKFQETLSYNQMKQLLFKEIQQNEDACKNKVFICEQTNSANAQDRDQFYAVIYASFKQVIKYKNVQYHLNGLCDISLIEQTCQQQFNTQVEKIYSEVEIQLGKLPSDDRLIQQKFNNLCDNLRSIGVVFEQSQAAQAAKQKNISISNLFQQKISDLQKLTDSTKSQEEICNLLIKFKLLAIDVPSYMEFLNKGIDQVLEHVYMSNNGPLRISEMGSILYTHTNAQIAQQILKDHQKFTSYSTELRNSGSLRFTLEDILDEKIDEKAKLDLGVDRAKGLRIQEDNAGTIVGTAVNRAEIRKLYADFDTKYWAQVEQYIYKVEDGKRQMKINVNNITKPFTTQSKIDVLTYIFTYWTLSNSQDYVGTNNKAESRKKLLQPHAAQVVAIFSLLGIDQSNQLKNQLIQVLTGEGKSVILAVTAIVLAIMGFDVNCACYSEYLSLRDFESFTDLFNAFNVRDNIVYGTFNQMCERYINENGEIRKLTEDCILKNKLDATKNNKMPRQKVLMIDEVDVFFNESFYGSSYTPMARVQNSEIKSLLDYVWQNRNQKNLMNKNSITKTQEYLNCEKSLKGWEELLKQALINMLADIEQFKAQQYVVHEGLIGYKDQDAISTRIFYGYQTLFAYYQEVENKTVKNEELQKRNCLYFNCGSFSYAEIPKQYTYIIGVTGTLDTVSKPEMKLLTDEYNIKKFSYLPSVYGLNKLSFAKDTSDSVKIVEQKEYFTTIVSEINKRRQNKIGIPVLVFFETSAKLDLFYKSREFKSIDNHQQVKLFTEKISPVEKEGVVRQAVTQNTVTLITREFGRGTDFVCYDKTIDGHGGVHVIQTFFSDELSEEKQIKGRTARQGNNGSYSLVLLDGELEKYGLVTRDIETMKARSQLYSTIDPKRQAFFEGKYPERIRNIKQIKEDHVKTNIFVKSLLGGNINAVKEFVIAENKANEVQGGESKTLILMDATGSMGGVIDRTKNTIKTMFTNAYTVLKENNYNQSFDIMFAAYRNYASGIDFVLQSSPWDTQPDNLKRFIDTIYSRDGEGNEAIEVGLAHAVSQIENGLKQVILIGDMPPNTKEEVRRKRANLGEAYWSTTRFAYPTYFEDQLQILKQNNIPVHALYVCNSAQQQFGYIARETGGKCEELDINSAKGAENLTNLVTEKIMLNIGGEALVKKYREKFGIVGNLDHIEYHIQSQNIIVENDCINKQIQFSNNIFYKNNLLQELQLEDEQLVNDSPPGLELESESEENQQMQTQMKQIMENQNLEQALFINQTTKNGTLLSEEIIIEILKQIGIQQSYSKAQILQNIWYFVILNETAIIHKIHNVMEHYNNVIYKIVELK
ncbi:Helicase-related_protein [Hexamita inflata]|uniref:Helicase-related protein n=1 Tax=Hexamita inflata TaxID=28002 RepID=A0AA86PC51_9EUKA|nr:Helicase-related protein [Hexamita inflata]CAI9942473.1 Helicase-related protein [Hexamita inflata]